MTEKDGSISSNYKKAFCKLGGGREERQAGWLNNGLRTTGENKGKEKNGSMSRGEQVR